jgi:hypothetical protein
VKDSEISESTDRLGIFAFEGDFDDEDLSDKTSIRPVLQLLHEHYKVPFIHRRIGTGEELDYYLEKWTDEQYANYRVGYLGFHGTEGKIWLGEEGYDLDRLEGLVGRGRAQGKCFYFGSCHTLDLHPARVTRFLRYTGAKAAIGHTIAPYWTEVAALSLILFDYLTEYRYTKNALKAFKRKHHGLADSLGLRIVIA